MWYHLFFRKYILEAAFIFGDTIDQSLILNFAGSKSQIWQKLQKANSLLKYSWCINLQWDLCVAGEMDQLSTESKFLDLTLWQAPRGNKIFATKKKKKIEILILERLI